MAKNPLDDGETVARDDRSKWTLQQHCDHANAQLVLNDTNEYRRREKGLPPVKWVIRNKRVEIELA